MTNAAHKRLTWLLAVVSCALFLCSVPCWIELRKTRNEIRRACDIIEGFQYFRKLGLRGEVSQAVDAFEMLRVGEAGKSLGNGLVETVERERTAATRDIVTYLRIKTGKDYGDDPEKWIEILRAGSQSTTDQPK